MRKEAAVAYFKKYHIFFFRSGGKTLKIRVSDVSVPSEIKIGHNPNRSKRYYRLNPLSA